MFTLLRIVSSTTVSELYFYVLISFSHGYSATLVAKLIIKLDFDFELALGGWLVTYRNKCTAPGIEPAHDHPSQY